MRFAVLLPPSRTIKPPRGRDVHALPRARRLRRGGVGVSRRENDLRAVSPRVRGRDELRGVLRVPVPETERGADALRGARGRPGGLRGRGRTAPLACHAPLAACAAATPATPCLCTGCSATRRPRPARATPRTPTRSVSAPSVCLRSTPATWRTDAVGVDSGDEGVFTGTVDGVLTLRCVNDGVCSADGVALRVQRRVLGRRAAATRAAGGRRRRAVAADPRHLRHPLPAAVLAVRDGAAGDFQPRGAVQPRGRPRRRGETAYPARGGEPARGRRRRLRKILLRRELRPLVPAVALARRVGVLGGALRRAAHCERPRRTYSDLRAGLGLRCLPGRGVAVRGGEPR